MGEKKQSIETSTTVILRFLHVNEHGNLFHAVMSIKQNCKVNQFVNNAYIATMNIVCELVNNFFFSKSLFYQNIYAATPNETFTRGD